MASVSVVIINWNSWALLARCLKALDAQTFTDFSVTVIDNASDDEMPARLQLDYPEVRLVRGVSNVGFAAANNMAIRKYTDNGEWIALINPDAFPEPQWLEALMAAANANSGFDVFASKLVNAADVTLLDGRGDAYHISGRVWRIGHGDPVSSFPELMSEVFSPCAAAAMYRRRAFLEIGGFDEDYFCYSEDVDLGFRMRLAGYRCLYVPMSVAHHVGSGTTGGQHSDFAVYYGHRNLVWTYVKNMPGVLFWFFLPLHLTMNLAALVVFALSGQAGVIFRAKWHAVLGMPKMWTKRRQVQKKRRVSWRAILRVMSIGWS